MLQPLIPVKETGDSEKDSICIMINICLRLSLTVRKGSIPIGFYVVQITRNWQGTWELGAGDGGSREGHFLGRPHTCTHTHTSPTPRSGDRPTALPYDPCLSQLCSLGEFLQFFVFGFLLCPNEKHCGLELFSGQFPQSAGWGEREGQRIRTASRKQNWKRTGGRCRAP